MAVAKSGPRKTGYLVARESFLAPGDVMITKGTVVEDSNPVVKGRESLFVPVEYTFRTRTN